MTEFGYCQWGCGGKAPIAKKNDASQGYVKGQPLRFISGHQHRRPLAERFWEKVNKDGPMPSAEAIAIHPEITGQQCWLYTSRQDYGNIRLADGRQVAAHRVAWFLETGVWPEQNCLHKCDRPGCVRFSHLFEGTDMDNTRDMLAKGRENLHTTAKLTEEQVAEIRRLGQPWVRSAKGRHRRGTATLLHQIAKRFGVDKKTIEKILRNVNWRT